jgi:adenylate cyclase class IV
MIEVELKYKISAAPAALARYPLIGEKSQVDAYYDTADRAGYRSGNFLRLRNGKRLDFKLNAGDATHLFCEELNFDVRELPEKSAEFNKPLALFRATAGGSYTGLDDMLEKNGLSVIGTIAKHRKEYRITDTIKVAIDEAKDIGLFLECEIMAESATAVRAEGLKAEMAAELRGRALLPPEAKAVNVGYLELYLYGHDRPLFDMGIYKDWNG